MTIIPGAPCPLCDRAGERIRGVDDRGYDQVNCETCGTFRISPVADRPLQGPHWKDRRWTLSGVTRRASDNESPVELRTDNLEEFAAFAQVPATPFDAIDRVMSLLSGRVTDIDGWTYLDMDRDYPIVFLRSRDQLIRIYQRVVELGYVKNAVSPDERTGLELTFGGWSKADALRRVMVNSDQAFVAMSFDDDMRALFTEGIAPALSATGYEPFRVDMRPHNEKIDDRIVTEIRQSGLVVADFTRHKGGAYWEAGFAQGLGIPVVRTCRKDDLQRLHFDTRQYLHIDWETYPELRERLELHIRATIPGRATAKARSIGAGSRPG